MGIESPVHLLFIAVVALIVLGPKRLPGLARALGQGIREFRQSLDEGASTERRSPPPPAVQTVCSTATPPLSAPTPHRAATRPSPAVTTAPGEQPPGAGRAASRSAH